MVSQDSLLVTLVQLVDRLPMPMFSQKRGRGHPKVYSDQLFLKALVIMIVRHLHNVHELRSRLAQPTADMQRLRESLCEHGQFPARRRWERRMSALPDTLPAQIGCLGRHLLDLIQPWAICGRAVAIASTVLRSRGGVWHQKHREQGEIPTPRLIRKPDFPKSGWQCSRLWLEVACRFRGRSGVVSHRCHADFCSYRCESACSHLVARSSRRRAVRLRGPSLQHA